MGSSQSVQLDDEDADSLSAESSFSREELQRLYSRFISLDKASDGALTPADLERIPELCINPIGSRLVASFFTDQERINFTDFVRLLSKFRTDSDAKLEEKRRSQLLHYLFKFYDGDCDGVISVDDLQTVLRDLLGKDTNPQSVRQLAERTVGSASNGGSLITFDDFERAMADQKDLLNIRFLD